MRDANPTVVLIPGVGMFSFGKNKTEARLTGEFYTNAIHVMEGATSLGTGKPPAVLPQAGAAAPTEAFKVHSNYVALPLSEAFRIEYWALEEAKIRRQPPEKELSRQVLVVVGGGSGIGREVALLAVERGAHVVVADRDQEGAQNGCRRSQKYRRKRNSGICARGHPQSRCDQKSPARSSCHLWRARYPYQHRRDLSILGRRQDQRRSSGESPSI